MTSVLQTHIRKTKNEKLKQTSKKESSYLTLESKCSKAISKSKLDHQTSTKSFLLISILLNAEADINLIGLSNNNFVPTATPRIFNSAALSITVSSHQKLRKKSASVLDHEITTALVFIGFTSIPQRLQKSPIRARSLLGDDITGTLSPGLGTLLEEDVWIEEDVCV